MNRWIKLSALEKVCDVKLESFLDSERRLCWRMSAKRRDQPEAKPIYVEAPEIADAVRLGVDAAMAQKWIES